MRANNLPNGLPSSVFGALTRLFAHERVIWEVALSSSEGASEYFETTDDHPWWIMDADGSGAWVLTEDLEIGMTVLSRADDAEDRMMTTTSVRPTEREDLTYNITVADFHTYFVGESRILVHNCPTGSYTHTFESGRTYDGKGDADRAAVTGRDIAARNNDPLVSTETRAAPHDRESFKQESRSLEQNGGARSENNYNQIDSPGTRYRREDGELE